MTLPLVRQSVQVAFVYLGIAALDAFAVVQVMTVGPGGPDGGAEVIGLSLYRNAFQYGKFGYASAMGVALFFAHADAGRARAAAGPRGAGSA